MNSKQMLICKLCLKTCHENKCKVLEGDDTQMLEVLLLQVDTKPSERCVICIDCMEMLQKCFEFKTSCLYVEDYISPFIKNGTKIDLKRLLHENINVDNDNNIKLCRLCMNMIKDNACKRLGEPDSQDLSDDVRNCLPELNINSVYDPLICYKCIKCLNEYRNFQKMFMNLYSFNERKECVNIDLSSNCKNESIEQNEKFDIFQEDNYNVKDSECEEQRTENYNTRIKVKVELDEINDAADMEHTRFEEVNIKEEPFETIGLSSVVQEEVCCCDKSGETSRDHNDKKEASGKDSKTLVLKYRYSKRIRIYQCNFCKYESKGKSLLIQHTQIHLDPSQRETFKCPLCNFTSNFKGAIKRHSLKHRELSEVHLYKCTDCDFETRWKNNLRKHQLHCCRANKSIKPDPKAGGKKMYKCDLCEFASPWKQVLKTHGLIHKDLSEIQLYKCNNCDFQTKWKLCLKRHLLDRCKANVNTNRGRKANRNNTIDKCEKCTYNTKFK